MILRRLALPVLAVSMTIAFQLPASAREPIDTQARNAWADLGDRIEAGADYAAAVEAARGPTCPVPGATFTSSWGAPRDGHTHQGNDLMAPEGTPILAPESGLFDGDGESFYLYADSGTTWFVTHNGGDLVPSGSRVARGQPVSTVSNTGNAAGGSPHAHTEIHPNDGPAIDPYPVLSAACFGQPEAATARIPRDPTYRYGIMEIHRWWNATHERIDGQTARTLTAYLNAVVGHKIGLYLQSLAIPYEANWDRVAACESGGDWSINTGNGYYGGVQYDYGTWLGAGGGQYAPRADLASKREQILISERVRADRGLSPWPHCGPRWYG